MGNIYTNPPQSRNEAILRATIDGTEYTAPPQSRIEDLLLELKEAIEQGGAGGMSKDTYDPDDVVADAGGIAAYVDDEITDLHLGTAAAKNSTSVVTQSSDLVESGAVKDAIGWGNKNKVDTSRSGGAADYGSLINYPITFNTLVISRNSDGSINLNGKNLNTTSFVPLLIPIQNFVAGQKVKIGANGLLNNRDMISISLRYNGEQNYATVGSIDVIDGFREVEVSSQAVTAGGINLCLRIGANAEFNNVTVYPMEFDNNISDTSYEPYHASVEETIPQVVSDAVGWDVSELLNITATSTTKNGVTFTVNADGSVSTSGTSNAEWIDFILNQSVSLKAGTYKLSGCNGGSLSTYRLVVYTPPAATNAILYDGETTFTLDFDTTAIVQITVRYSNVDMNGKVFKPSITHVTVDEQKADNSVIGTVEGENASKAWSVGEHFIKDGQFKEVTQAISSGGAISDSNTKNKPIADCFAFKGYITSTSDDLDNYLGNGIYSVSANASNVPEGKNYGVLIVSQTFQSLTENVIQLYGSAYTGEGQIYIRRRSQGVWRPWFKFTGTIVS